MKKVTIVSKAEYRHGKDGLGPDITGLTIRQALIALRKKSWGAIESMCPVTLSDGSELCVDNPPAVGGGQLMGIHNAYRTVGYGDIVAKYRID